MNPENPIQQPVPAQPLQTPPSNNPSTVEQVVQPQAQNGPMPISPISSSGTEPKNNPKKMIIIGFVLMGAGIMLSATLILIPIGLPLAIVGLFLIIRASRKYTKQQTTGLESFATSQGLNSQVLPDKNIILDSSIFRYFTGVSVKNMTYKDMTSIFFECDAHLGAAGTATAANSGSGDYYSVVRRVALPQSQADFILTPTDSISSHPFKLDHHSNLQLEGDIPKYFQLFVDNNTQNESLEFLSPDVIQWLIVNVSSGTIICRNQTLYLFIPVIADLTVAPPAPNSYQYQYDATDKIVSYLKSKISPTSSIAQ